MPDVDVLIVGAGPAGLASAVACRRAGFSVLLVDARRPPIDKTCGEGLMPEWFAAAHQLGIKLPDSIGVPFVGIRFREGLREASARFRSGTGRGVRRTSLHEILLADARGAGVQFEWNSPVSNVRDGSAMAGSQSCSARWIIAADGAQSKLRRDAGITCSVHPRARFSYRRHYRVAPWSEFVDVHWGNACQIYVAPIGHEEVSLILVTRNPKQRLDDALLQFPDLADRVISREHLSPETGAAASTRCASRVHSARLILVGDASGTVDPITGEGISIAFRQSIALAHALSENNLHLYQEEHRRIMRRPRAMGQLLLFLDRFPVARRYTLSLFERCPQIFSALLAHHTGASNLHECQTWNRTSERKTHTATFGE